MDAALRTYPLPGLRPARRAALLTQEALARRAGVAALTVRELERGKRGAYPGTVKKLAAALELAPAALLGFPRLDV